jgi:hypothetical protein
MSIKEVEAIRLEHLIDARARAEETKKHCRDATARGQHRTE